MTGKGVEALSIPEIEKAAGKYERKKEARCQVSPGEVAAKRDLLAALQKNRDKLPKNAEGLHFYRYEGRDYILEESLKQRKVEEGDDAGNAGSFPSMGDPGESEKKD